MAIASAGCAKGTTEDVELASGMYELTTTAVEGDCVLEDAITPGEEFVGKVVRVTADSADERVKLEPCDDFFPDQCMPAAFAEPLSMIRDAQLLRGEDRQW